MESSSAVDAATILIAEDEAMVRMVEAETLRDAGYDIREARDGNAALEILKSDAKVDLLITDIKMPGMSGYQLAEAGTELRPRTEGDSDHRLRAGPAAPAMARPASR